MAGEVWTAGRDTREDPGKYIWCSQRLRDYVKADLYWKEIPAGQNNSCVYLDLGKAGTKNDYQKLGFADCNQRKKFLCEVRIDRRTFLLKTPFWRTLEF